jgi:PAS domain S-box-containing protein
MNWHGIAKWQAQCPSWVDFWDHAYTGKGACGVALQRGERVIVEDVTTSPIFVGTPALEVQLKAGVRAVQSTPLTSRTGKALGMFSTHFKTPHRPDERSLRLLDLLARQTADMIERAEAEAALRESEERFHATFDQAAVGIAEVSPEGRWMRVNQKLCDIVGYSREELLLKTFQDITHPDDLDVDLVYVRQMLAGEIKNYSLEKRYFRKDGSLVWINLTVALVCGETGQPNYFISVVEDITEQKMMEENLRQAKEEAEKRAAELDQAFEVIPIGMFLVDRQGGLYKANKAANDT